MIEMNPDYFIAACFIIFIYLMYKPTKSYIETFLDKNIDILQKNINEAKNIVKDTKKLLDETKSLVENFQNYKNSQITKNNSVNNQALNCNKIEYDQILKHKKTDFLSEIAIQKQLLNKKINSDYIETVINITRIYCIENNNNQVSDVDIAKILQQIPNF